jgi:hypothetical protein
MCALTDNDRETEVIAVIKMGEGPPQVSYRRDPQTTLRCFLGDWEVLNGIGKKSCWKDYVRLEKMNESEPSMRCRENELSVKTTGTLTLGEECSGYLFTGYMADVIKKA